MSWTHGNLRRGCRPNFVSNGNTKGLQACRARYADKHLTESKPKPNQSTVSAKKGVKQLDKPVKGQNMDPKGKPVESVKCAKVKPSQPTLRYT